MWGKTETPLEHAREVGRRPVHECTQVGYPDGLGDVSLDVLPDPARLPGKQGGGALTADHFPDMPHAHRAPGAGLDLQHRNCAHDRLLVRQRRRELTPLSWIPR